jgi:hypothetical protein
MVNKIIESATTLTDVWKNLLQNEGGKAEIMVHSHLKIFSAKIISRVSFGNSYAKGEVVHPKFCLLQTAISKSDLFTAIPGSRFVLYITLSGYCKCCVPVIN